MIATNGPSGRFFERPRTYATHTKQVLVGWGLATTGISLLGSFSLDATLPLPVGVLALAVFATWGLYSLGWTGRAVLPRLMVVVYCLPFSTLLGYLGKSTYTWGSTPQKLALINDQRLMRQLVAVGTIGLLGLLAGLHIGSLRRRCPKRLVAEEATALPVLSRAAFAGLLAVAVLISWLAASSKSILQAAYASGGATDRAVQLGFNAAGLVGYVALGVLFIDAERDHDPAARRAKYVAVLVTTGLVVLVFQLLRGDRESSGLLAGLAALYITRHNRRGVGPTRQHMRRRFRRLALPAVVVFGLFIAVGSLRSTLSDNTAPASPTSAFRAGLAQNTWTGVLDTNLAMAGEYRYGPMQYLKGSTYVDYVKSLPPGVVTHALGIERAIEPTHSPGGWSPGVAAGGAHAVLVPFKNFGAPGVFVILGLYGALIARVESNNRARSLWGRLIFAAFATSSLQWFWYSDLVLVRGLMAAVILGVVYVHLARSYKRLPSIVRRELAPQVSLSIPPLGGHLE